MEQINRDLKSEILSASDVEAKGLIKHINLYRKGNSQGIKIRAKFPKEEKQGENREINYKRETTQSKSLESQSETDNDIGYKGNNCDN